jgi:Lanthionine synthetase C-like protein
MQRYIPNDKPLKPVSPHPELVACLTSLVQSAPPERVSHAWKLHGLFDGPTGIAYLFLRLSQTHPNMKIGHRSARQWAEAYIDASYQTADDNALARNGYPVDPNHCGVANEILARTTVYAAIYQDTTKAMELCRYGEGIVKAEEGSNEWLYGRAGYLYLLRVVAAWVGGDAEEVPTEIERTKTKVVKRILQTPQPWVWHGQSYLGAAHGAIGIVTQLVLSLLDCASELEETLECLLSLQLPSGNWPPSLPSTARSYTLDSHDKRRLEKDGELVQFCHGAPGLVTSLISIRASFPNQRKQIDEAVEIGRAHIWERGILVKESCLCHGTCGNALCLPQSQFEQMLAVSTEEKVKEMGRLESSDSPYGLYTGMAGRAWAWAVADSDIEQSFLGYNDV